MKLLLTLTLIVLGVDLLLKGFSITLGTPWIWRILKGIYNILLSIVKKR